MTSACLAYYQAPVKFLGFELFGTSTPSSSERSYPMPRAAMDFQVEIDGVVAAQDLPDVAETERQLERFVNQPTQAAIAALSRLPEDWDGAESAAPRSEAIALALNALPDMYSIVGLARWERPHVSASEFGDVTFEWWNDSRKVTLYIDGEKVSAVRVWGADIHAEMEYSQVRHPGDFASLWAWLTGG